MPLNKQIGRASASEYLSRKPRPPFARGDGDLALPKLVRSAMLAAKSLVSGECRFTAVVLIHHQTDHAECRPKNSRLCQR
jgi:hypothetical protein